MIGSSLASTGFRAVSARVHGGPSLLSHNEASLEREAWMLEGDRRQSDFELARQKAGDEEIRRNYRKLQLLKLNQNAAAAAEIARADSGEIVFLPTYGKIRPDDSDYDPEYCGRNHKKKLSLQHGEEMKVSPDEWNCDEPEDDPNYFAALGPASTSIFGSRLNLHLNEIPNEKVRAIFDPARLDDAGSIDSLLTWSDKELEQLLTEMRPEHMAVLMRKRIHSHKQQPAKRLSFHHLNYFENGDHIIKDCSGFVEPGEMVGVSGGPDSGVTALLGLLAGRLKPNLNPGMSQVELPGVEKSDLGPGYILLDGKRPDANFTDQVGYAVKADIHLPYLTVEETLYFSARLRLHRSLPDRVVRFRVLAMMKLLGLSHVANTQVGDAMVRGVSGGEKRRVGFGVEMVAGHSVIIADLPTNGLDSATALSLLQSMSYACAGGFSLVFSIVQASQAILDTMDRLILMCKGSVIFTGPPRESERYFRALGFHKPKTKALPQFLEEMSANPERFWQPHIAPHVGTTMTVMGMQFTKQSPHSEGTNGNGRSNVSKSLRLDEDESHFTGTYDPSLDLPPRRQAYLALRRAWHRAPAYRSMTELLASSDRHHSANTSSLMQHLRARRRGTGKARKNKKAAKEDAKEAAFQQMDRKWTKSLMQLTQANNQPQASPQPQSSSQPPVIANGHGNGNVNGNINGNGTVRDSRVDGELETIAALVPFHANQLSPPPLVMMPTGSSSFPPAALPSHETDHDREISTTHVKFHTGGDEFDHDLHDLDGSEKVHDAATHSYPQPSASPDPSFDWRDQDAVDTNKIRHQLARHTSNDSTTTAAAAADAPDIEPEVAETFTSRMKPPSNRLERWWFHRYSSTPWIQFRENFRRQFLATLRNYGLWRDIWILAVLIGVIIGLLFYQLGVDVDGIKMRVGLFFFIISYQAFNAVQLVPVLAQQRPIYYHQMRLHFHCAFAYYLPLALIQIPIVCIESILLLTPIHGISNLSGIVWGGLFWYAFLAITLNALIARTFMVAIYAVSPNEAVADVINQVTNILFSKLCGFFIAFSSIPIGWRWVYHISWFSYSLRGLAKNDITDLERPCQPTIDEACLYQNGPEALEYYYKMDTDIGKWTDIQDLVWFFLTFHFGAAVLLAFIDFSRMDRMEAPEFGTKRQQMAERAEIEQALHPKAVTNVAAQRALEKSIAMPNQPQHQQQLPQPVPSAVPSPHSLSVPTLGAHASTGEVGKTLTVPASSEHLVRSTSEQTSAAPSHPPPPHHHQLAHASSMSLTLKRRRRPSTLQRVLRTYQTADDLDEFGEKPQRNSYIVVPISGDATLRPRNWVLPSLKKRTLSLGADARPSSLPIDVPPSSASPPLSPVTIQLVSPPAVHTPSMRPSGMPQIEQVEQLEPSINYEPSLTLADRRHYQYQVKHVDIDAMLGAPKPATTSAHPSGAILEWYDLTYSVPVQKDGKTVQRKLLDNVYGMVRPGLMMALMGSSGAGKSTLLDVLANKKTGGTLSGTLLMNGQPRGVDFAHVSGYVEQWDSHHPYSTVRESLEFSGRLRLREPVSDDELARRVDNVLAILGIEHLQDQLIGGDGIAGVSQEVRKKVTIGVELVTEPILLFLDEPTTGLDAAGAYSVCHAIRNLASRIAVICTIHQPSEEIIKMFDGLLLMQPGGQVAYCGSVADLPHYFAEHRLGLYKPSMNVADFALESIREVTTANQRVHKGGPKKEDDPKPSADTAHLAPPGAHAVPPSTEAEMATLKVPTASPSPSPSPSDETKADTSVYRDLPKEFLASAEGSQLMHLLRSGGLHKGTINPDGSVAVSLPLDGTNGANGSNGAHDSSAPSKSSDGFIVPPQPLPLRSFWTQLQSLMARDFDAIMRNHEDLFVRYFLTIIMGFVVGTVFYQLSDSQEASEYRVSALFVTLLFIMFTANAFLPQMFFSRPMYFREHTAGAYSPAPFYLSRLIVQLPFVLTEQLILAIMLHYIADLSHDDHDVPLAWMYLCFVVTRYASITATYFIGALFAQPNNANTIHATYFNLLFAFTGFLVRGPRIPVGWEWFYDINYLRWALSFLVANEERHRDFVCEADEYVLAPADYSRCNDPQSVTTVGASPQFIPPNAAISAISNPNTVLKCATACGYDLMDEYGVESSDGEMAKSLGLVAVFAVGFGIAGFVTLKYVNHIRR